MEFTAGGPAATAFEGRQPIIIRDARKETRFTSAIAMMRDAGWLGLCHCPLVSTRGLLGTLNLASRSPLDYDSRQMDLLGEVARLGSVLI